MKISLYILFILLPLTLSANQVMEKADTIATKTVQAIKTADTIATQTYQTIEKFLKKHYPEVKRIFREYVAPVTREAIKNEAAMRLVFGNSYELLPMPVRVIVPREDFIRYGMKHRYKLLKVVK